MPFLPLAHALVAGCMYPSKSSQGQWIRLDRTSCLDKQGRIGKTLRKDLDFSGGRLSWFTTDEPFAVFYVRKDGTFKQTHWFDNGPDYFDSGYVRLVVDGKYGFMDSALRVIIKPQWDFAFPFQDGYAQVGNVCRTEKVDAEHSALACQDWYRIDRRGKVFEDSPKGTDLRP